LVLVNGRLVATVEVVNMYFINNCGNALNLPKLTGVQPAAMPTWVNHSELQPDLA